MAANPIIESFLANQGFALFEYADNGVFRPIGDYPKWCEKIWSGAVARDKTIRLAEVSPFIENFLTDAEGFWNSQRDGSANSPVWIERDSAGRETPLEAAALHLDGKNVLLLCNLSKTYADRQKLFQAARDSLLAHERLLHEVQKKEILLHCIIHDLSQPLTAMRGCFSLLALEDLSADLRRMVETGQRESNRQEQMIRGILQAFSADLTGHPSSGENVSGVADIAACAERAVREFSPAFKEKEIRLQIDPAVDTAREWIVTGDESRLDRIFGNLLENALRYSPRGTTVTIGLEDRGKVVLAFVDDEGPGLPKDQSADKLFALFSKGIGQAGQSRPRALLLQDYGRTMGRDDWRRIETKTWNSILVSAPSRSKNRVRRRKERSISPAGNFEYGTEARTAAAGKIGEAATGISC